MHANYIFLHKTLQILSLEIIFAPNFMYKSALVRPVHRIHNQIPIWSLQYQLESRHNGLNIVCHIITQCVWLFTAEKWGLILSVILLHKVSDFLLQENFCLQYYSKNQFCIKLCLTYYNTNMSDKV